MRDLFSLAQAAADVGRGNCKSGPLENMKAQQGKVFGWERQPGKTEGMSGTQGVGKKGAGTLNDQEFAELNQFVKIAPASDALKIVRPQKKKKSVACFLPAEFAKRINGVGDSTPLDFDVDGLKSRFVRYRGPHHGHAMAGADQFAVCFVRGDRARDEKNLINGKSVKRVMRDLKMSQVNGIECAAKDRDFQWFEKDYLFHLEEASMDLSSEERLFSSTSRILT